MRARAKPAVLITTLLLLLAALVLAVPALAGEHEPPRKMPQGPPTLPLAASDHATKPVLERSVQVLQAHEGQNVGDGFGWVGMQLGDMTGDGVNEYLITAPFYASFTTLQGRNYLYSGADGALIQVHTGDPGNNLGWSAAPAGDVDDDGIDDYALSGPGFYGGGAAGRVVVYSGADHSILYDWSGAPGNGFGSWIDGLGDLDGDGHDDLAVGAQLHGAQAAGRVTVYSGADGSVLWTRDGLQAGDQLGAGVGAIGDVDGDGVGDVVAAASSADNANGRAYVFSGADGELIHELAPTAPLSSSGTYGTFFARGAGDVDADGIEDVFIGDYGALGGDGRTYIYSGDTGNVLHVIEAQMPGDGVGPGRGVPDVDGDGHDDLVIASWTSSSSLPLGGKVAVYSGADGSVLQQATGSVANDALGVDALPLGDLNVDGRQEYMLTAVGLDFLGMDVGHVYVVTFNAPPGVLPGR